MPAKRVKKKVTKKKAKKSPRKTGSKHRHSLKSRTKHHVKSRVKRRAKLNSSSPPLEVKLDLLGYEDKNIKVLIKEGCLVVEAVKAEEIKEDRGGYIHEEIAHHNFIYAVKLPKGYENKTPIKTYKDGTLYVRFS